MNLNKRLINISLTACLLAMFCLAQGSDDNTMVEELKIENALQDKLSHMIENKILDESDYVLIVNATMRKKPLSTSSTPTSSAPDSKTSFTLPGFPLKNLQENTTSTNLADSNSDYLLYFLEVVVYVEGSKISGKLKSDLRKIIVEGVPDIRDCEDCIRIEQMDFNGSGPRSTRVEDLIEQIEELEEAKASAEKQIVNWKFDQLEEALALSEDARQEWELQARERETERDRQDAEKLVELEEIRAKYYADKDALLGEYKEEIKQNKEQGVKREDKLIDLLAGRNTSEEIPAITEENPPAISKTTKWIIWIIIGVVILLVLITILILLFKKNKKPIYLKPTTPSAPINNLSNVMPQQPTSAYESDDVVRSELNSLRQSAVSMSVGQKEGATQIVKDWLDIDGEEENQNNE